MASSLCGQLQSDLRGLSTIASQNAKFRQVKEAAESGLLKLKTVLTANVGREHGENIGDGDKMLYKLLEKLLDNYRQ